MATFNRLVPAAPLQTTPLKRLQRVCAHKERLQFQSLHWVLMGLRSRTQQSRPDTAQQPHSGLGVKRKAIQEPLRIFYSKEQKKKYSMFPLTLSHKPLWAGVSFSHGKKKNPNNKNLILGEKILNRVMMFCSMFLWWGWGIQDGANVPRSHWRHSLVLESAKPGLSQS